MLVGLRVIMLLMLLILFLPLTAKAGCEDIAYGKNKTISIDISDGGCATETLITFTKRNKDGSVSKGQYPFHKECTLTETGFSCHARGHTPLAGATYKLVKHGKSRCNSDDPNDPGYGANEPGYRYVCIKGCGKGLPKYLEQSEDCC